MSSLSRNMIGLASRFASILLNVNQSVSMGFSNYTALWTHARMPLSMSLLCYRRGHIPSSDGLGGVGVYVGETPRAKMLQDTINDSVGVGVRHHPRQSRSLLS